MQNMFQSFFLFIDEMYMLILDYSGSSRDVLASVVSTKSLSLTTRCIILLANDRGHEANILLE